MMSGDIYDELTRLLRYPVSKNLRRVFELMVTPEEATVLAEMSQPVPAEVVAEKLDLPVETVETHVESMHQKGLIALVGYTDDGKALNVFGGHGNTTPESVVDGITHTMGVYYWDDEKRTVKGEKNQEILDALLKFVEEDWFRWERVDELVHRREAIVGEVGLTMSVMPAYKALEKSGINLPDEAYYWDARLVAKKAERISVTMCPCRIRARRCDLPLWTCTAMDLGYYPYDRALEEEKRGIRKRHTPEEWLETLGHCEDLGMVHTGMPPFGSFACTCDTCCCSVFVPLMKYAKPSEGMEKAPFRAIVHDDSCQGCPDCIAKCRFQAVKIVKDPHTGKKKAQVNEDKCFGCGQCVVQCKVDGAITMKWLPEEGGIQVERKVPLLSEK